MKINNFDVVERNNRPNISQRVALRTFFFNDGLYQDPVEISSVHIFRANSNVSPSTVLDSTTEVVNFNPLMYFGNSSVDVTNVIFNVSNYTPGTTTSGIYKLGTGQYAVVLDGTVALSASYSGSALGNAASNVGNYIDVWTVRHVSGSNYTTHIHYFKLVDDTFVSVSEPLLISTRETLSPKKITLGSKVDLKINVLFNIDNRSTPEEVLNIFKDGLLSNPAVEILKHNDDVTIAPARVTVSSFAQTSSLVDSTSNNTLVFNWDTSLLTTHPQALAGNLVSPRGIYSIQPKYTILNEIKYGQLMFIEVS